MFKKVKKVISLLAIPLTLTYLSSCSFFNTGKEDSYMIKSIEAEQFEDGSTKVTITYDDEEKEPVVFYIPKGEQGDIGETGNGIAGIENKGSDSSGEYTIMEITYTDTSIPSTEFKVPNGVSIETMESSLDNLTGITTVTITLTNGESLSFTLPRGKDGNDGNGITFIEHKVKEDQSVDIILYFTNGSSYTVTIPAPQKGEDGRGISSMVANETDSKYIITVNYTDGTKDTLELSKPEDANSWLSGYGNPNDNGTEGKNGDFYFDFNTNTIYHKTNGKWEWVYSFTDSGNEYTVKFDLNDTVEAPATMKGDLSYPIERGNYFASAGYTIPEPTRTGYEFVGWYTTKTPGPTNGAFTDLTPVFSDLTLYANWSKI